MVNGMGGMVRWVEAGMARGVVGMVRGVGGRGLVRGKGRGESVL